MATLLRQPSRYLYVPWQRLKPMIRWDQGQHVFTCGGTGTGKSTVAGQFLNRRAQVVVFVSKGRDPIFAESPYVNYETITDWPPPRTRPGKPPLTHVLLWPKNEKTGKETRTHKQDIFRKALDDILLVRGNWCIDVDETHYVSDTLSLRDDVSDILEQGRSAGISMWNNTQRPAGIPLAVYVNSVHAFLFQTQEEYDVRRLSNLKNRHTNVQEMMYNLDQLESFKHHELMYLDRSGRIPPCRTIVVKGRQTSGTDKREVRPADTAQSGGMAQARR